jgi:hypothetical protein
MCRWCSYLTGDTPMGPHSLLTEIVLLFYVQMMFLPHGRHTYGPPQPVDRDSFTVLYAGDTRTSQETHLQASTACYGASFTFLYVDDTRTSQETPIGLHSPLLFTFSYTSVLTDLKKTHTYVLFNTLCIEQPEKCLTCLKRTNRGLAYLVLVFRLSTSCY